MYCSVLEVFLEAPAPTLYPTEGQRAEVHNTCIIYCDTHTVGIAVTGLGPLEGGCRCDQPWPAQDKKDMHACSVTTILAASSQSITSMQTVSVFAVWVMLN